MTDRVARWEFGETEADVVAWLQAPALLHAYVDVRTPETPPGYWERVMIVTRAWVERQIAAEGTGPQSWPPLVIVPDGSRAAVHRSIDLLLADGGWKVVLRNSSRIRDADRQSAS